MIKLIMNEFCCYGKPTIRAKKPMDISVEYTGGAYILKFPDTYPELKDDWASDSTLGYAIVDLENWIHFVWEDYVECDEKELAPASILFRNRLKEIFERD